MKKLYLVDVSSMFFRAFYAIRALSNPAGMPVNALYGFLSMTVKLMREIHPDYMVFCFDRPEPSFRKEMDSKYKANRTEMPADLVPQIPYFRRLSEALGVTCIDRLGFEADDIIGTLTKMGREHGLEVVIVSGDKDFAQLIKPFVTMYDTMKDVRYDEAGVVGKWGIEPRKMIDYLAIVGDSSDNIAGVAGIGEKGAQKLLAQFDSLEDIYERLDGIASASIRNKLEASREAAFLAKRLVTIVCDVPLDLSLDLLRLKSIDRENLANLLAELDFKTFARTLLGDSVQAPKAEVPIDVAPVETLSDSAVTVGASVEESMSGYSLTEQRLDLAGLDRWLKPGEETWALQTERGSYLAQGEVITELAADGPELGSLLMSKGLKLKGYDLKDFCKHHDMKIENPHTSSSKSSQLEIIWDQMIAAYVVRAGAIENPQSLFTLYNGQSLPDIPTSSQLLASHLNLEKQLRRKVASIQAEKILFDIELPLIPILLSMEQAGILVDSAELLHQSEDLTRDISRLTAEIHIDAGEVFNIGSPKQMGRILFDKMKMPTGKKTKSGYSTDADVLEKLAVEYPFVQKILEWRELSKLKSTYVDSLPQLCNKTSGRVHTTFNQALTSTGRLSSINPNLQNIPIRTERGNRIRKAFMASPGQMLVSADYSQIELRILAHITEDRGLMRAFEENLDIHTSTASEVFDVPLADVTSEQRRRAKAVNFGLAYGQGAFGLAESLRISRGEATGIINRYFERFPRVKSFMTDTIEEAKKKGYVETVLGRRRYLDELFSQSAAVRKFGERAAINAPIQGTASDLVKLAMIKVFDPKQAKMLLQVHDELIFEVNTENVEAVSGDITHKMESVTDLKVPLKVNTGYGATWFEAH
jgi:DNA polymerase-1